MANPIPEIMPALAKEAGAIIVATGRSDFPNQVNNLLGFPGIFQGVLNVRTSDINEEMKIAAAKALAGIIKAPNKNNIIPSVFDKNVVPVVAKAVADAAKRSSVAKSKIEG
jgi:malate dehydrogenase (oxaloacetate-decarboxylating)